MSPRNEPDHDADGAGFEDDEENQQQQPQRQRKKTKLFTESGLSDTQRRQIRQDQRQIQQSLRENEYSTFDDIENVRDKNNQVFQTSVCFTREAVLDADNVDLIATKYAKQIEKQVQVPRFDAIQLVHKLGQKCTNKTSTSQYFDWKFLGVEAGICFNAIPERVTFLAGALDHQVTVKAKTVRQARVKSTISDEVEVKPEAVDNTANKGDADKLSAMEKAMRVIRKKLKARSEEIERSASSKNGNADEHPDIDMVQFLFNPQSFTQTVENIFNFSFLIKKGEAAIGVRPKSSLGNSHGAIPSGAYVAYRTYNASAFESDPNDNNSSSSSATQAVCRFTMADWRRLCQQQDAASTTGSFAQGDIPHRTGTKHGRNSQ